MKTPVSFGGSTGVLNRSMVLIITLYVGLGLLGFLQYGNEAAGSITLNLPETEKYGDNIYALAKKIKTNDMFVFLSAGWPSRCS